MKCETRLFQRREEPAETITQPFGTTPSDQRQREVTARVEVRADLLDFCLALPLEQ